VNLAEQIAGQLSRFDWMLLRKIAAHRIPYFTKRSAEEHRAFDLYEKGLLSREWTTFAVTRLHEDMRWAYSVSKTGAEMLRTPRAKGTGR
jgi:hypothetical protein